MWKFVIFVSITDIMSDEAIVLGETATTKDGVIERRNDLGTVSTRDSVKF